MGLHSILPCLRAIPCTVWMLHHLRIFAGTLAVIILSCGRELLEITEKLIRDMPTDLPGTVREGATALQLLKGAKNEEVHT